MNRRDNRNCIPLTKCAVEDIELEENPKLIVPVTDKRERRPHSPTVDVVFKKQHQKQTKEETTDGVNWQGCRYD